MSDGGLTILDGTQLTNVEFTLPLLDGGFTTTATTGAQLLQLAESRVSKPLFGIALPEALKSSALHRLGITDDVNIFRSTELDRENASSFLLNYVAAIANELKDDPIVVAILDGSTLRVILEDEDDFAMLAENLFTDIDTEDRGKIRKSEVWNALAHMGTEMGIPPLSEFPQLSEILKKHNADGEGELGQAQFAQLLQPVLQELADAIAEKHVVIVQNVKIVNGSKIKALLGSQKHLNDVVEKIIQEKHNKNDEKTNKEMIRYFLEENGKELGLPPLKADDMVVLLYDAVFADVEDVKTTAGSENSLMVLLKEILQKFAEELEANPFFYDLAM